MTSLTATFATTFTATETGATANVTLTVPASVLAAAEFAAVANEFGGFVAESFDPESDRIAVFAMTGKDNATVVEASDVLHEQAIPMLVNIVTGSAMTGELGCSVREKYADTGELESSVVTYFF